MKRVLCVDDDAPIRAMLQDLLAEMGYHVDAATDGAEGLKLWEKQSYDLVITDLLLPKIDGIRLAERIREKAPSAKILVITAINHSLEKELQTAPIDGYFAKPLNLSKLRAKVKQLLSA